MNPDTTKALHEIFRILARTRGLHIETDSERVILVHDVPLGEVVLTHDVLVDEVMLTHNGVPMGVFMWFFASPEKGGNDIYNEWLLNEVRRGGMLMYRNNELFCVPCFETPFELDMKLQIAGHPGRKPR